MNQQRIVFVTNAQVEPAIVSALRDKAFAISTETDLSFAYQRLLTSPPDLLIIDVLDPREAIETLKQIRSSAKLKRTSVMVIAEWGTGLPMLALSNGADAFEPKPIDLTRLIASVQRLLGPDRAMSAKASSSINNNAD